MLFFMPARTVFLTIDQLITDSLHSLLRQGIETSKFELRLLAAFVLKTDLNTLVFYKQPLSEKQIAEFNRLVEQRKNHCPVDKIIGRKGFYKYDFEVSEAVLSPRADTEILVEEAVALVRQENLTRVLEFGVGSGCIILSILADCPEAFGSGIDISAQALEIARRNAEKLGTAPRLDLINASWFDKDVCLKTGGGFDMIISNPPYIPSGDIQGLDAEVKDFDPITALDGGKDGLRDYRQIARIAGGLLKDGGYLIFEAGINQAKDIIAIAQDNGFEKTAVLKDLGGIERCIVLKKQFTFPKVRIL